MSYYAGLPTTVPTQTVNYYGPVGSRSSSTMNFVLSNLSQNIKCDVSGVIDQSQMPTLAAANAQAVFYVKTQDMKNVFKFHVDSLDSTNFHSDDMAYYCFMDQWPSNLIINPAHAMMDAVHSSGALIATSDLRVQSGVVKSKNLVKHDYLRYLSLELFGSPYGVDLFSNEQEMLESLSASGHRAWQSILYLLDSISANPVDSSGGRADMSSTLPPRAGVSQADLAKDPSGNRCYRTDQRRNLNNLTAQLLQQIESIYPQRFYNILASQVGEGASESSNNYVSVPFHDGDVINFQLTVAAPDGQGALVQQADDTGDKKIPDRVYDIRLVLYTPDSATNPNTQVVDCIPILGRDEQPHFATFSSDFPYCTQSVEKWMSNLRQPPVLNGGGVGSSGSAWGHAGGLGDVIALPLTGSGDIALSTYKDSAGVTVQGWQYQSPSGAGFLWSVSTNFSQSGSCTTNPMSGLSALTTSSTVDFSQIKFFGMLVYFPPQGAPAACPIATPKLRVVGHGGDVVTFTVGNEGNYSGGYILLYYSQSHTTKGFIPNVSSVCPELNFPLPPGGGYPPGTWAQPLLPDEAPCDCNVSHYEIKMEDVPANFIVMNIFVSESVSEVPGQLQTSGSGLPQSTQLGGLGPVLSSGSNAPAPSVLTRVITLANN